MIISMLLSFGLAVLMSWIINTSISIIKPYHIKYGILLPTLGGGVILMVIAHQYIPIIQIKDIRFTTNTTMLLMLLIWTCITFFCFTIITTISLVSSNGKVFKWLLGISLLVNIGLVIMSIIYRYAILIHLF